MRIAIGGIRHETNTFSPLRTGLDKFAVERGVDIMRDSLWSEWVDEDIEFVPALVAEARPDAVVDHETYIRLKGELIERLTAALPVDGIYLDLHGAMEVEGIGDGESDLISAVRACVGSDVLVSVSLDLHANVAPLVLEGANILTAFRTAPHRDETATRRRAVSHLIRCLQTRIKPVAIMIKLPLLLPGEFAVTDIEPARSLYSLLDKVDRVPGILDCSIVIGCAWTDSPYTAVSVIVVAEHDHAVAHEQAARLATAVWAQRTHFGPETPTMAIDDAIVTALSRPERPVFLSDAGDNVTAGAAGDIPLAAERLIAAGAVDAAVMGLADAQAVADCAKAGLGGRVTTQLGGKLDTRNGSPLTVTGVVAHLDPPEQPTLAVLRVEGVDIVVTADRRGFTTRASFTQANIDPRRQKIVVVKQGYLFPELREQAALAFMILSPGCTDLRLDALPFQRLRRPIFPLDNTAEWSPENR